MNIHRTALFLFFLWGILGRFWGTMLKTGTFRMFFAHFSLILAMSHGFESLIVHQQKRRTLRTSFLFLPLTYFLNTCFTISIISLLSFTESFISFAIFNKSFSVGVPLPSTVISCSGLFGVGVMS